MSSVVALNKDIGFLAFLFPEWGWLLLWSEALLSQDVDDIGKPGKIIKSVLSDENDLLLLLLTTTTQREPRNKYFFFTRHHFSFF